MQATCPHCQTVFKVSDENLKLADGYVRCGICKEVFNALEKNWLKGKKEPAAKTKIEPTISAKKAGAQQPATKNKMATAQKNPFPPAQKNEQASTKTQSAKPVVSKSSQSNIKSSVPEKKTPPVTSNVPQGSTAKSASQTRAGKVTDANAAANKPGPVSAKSTRSSGAATTKKTADSNDLFSGVQSKLIPDEYRIPELHNTYSIWSDISWSVAILILTASLFVEYTWFNRNALIRNPQLRPLITQFCDIANCDTIELRDPGEIEMTTRNIYTHPNVNNALMISGTLINHAPFEQPYPNILIDFSDVRGEVIASRIFTPEDYLQIKVSNLKPLTPESPVDFNMEIQDPGKDASTYEFSFL